MFFRCKKAVVDQNTPGSEANVSDDTSKVVYPDGQSSERSERSYQRRFAVSAAEDPGRQSHKHHNIKPTNKDVIYDDNNKLISDHNGNIQFQTIVRSFYDMYKYARTATASTHRSIIRSSMLHDLKSKHVRFLAKKQGSFYELDDIAILDKIKKALKEEGMEKKRGV